ncbi:DUF4221 family protein [Algoriphagus aquimarinus]|uniref:DUF4221 family protein n=1 Tax=Algoriphagus aquimarinus TaxID=237018 RepID=UPI0030DD33DC|tara:strand:+ start:209 stop:1351 length:1143 start_codon:yes stop_codon:yes gene_type:complete
MKIIYYLLLFIIFGCKSPIQKTRLNTETYESLSIEVKANFNPDRTRTQYYESDSGEYLAILNKSLNRIEIFNLETKVSERQIPLAKDGPNRVGVTNGFQIVALDCLLLATIPPQIKIIDFNGIIKKSIPVNDQENKVNFLSSNNEIPLLFGANSVFGAQPFFQNFFKMNKKDIAKYTPIYKINLSDKSLAEWLQISHPSDIWENGKKTEKFSWADRYDTIIVAPHADHRLWLISKDRGNLLGYKDGKSISVNNFHIINELSSGDKGIIENIVSDRYEIILHDSYRDVFYRFFFVGIDWESYNLSPRDLFANRPRTGVLVLDKNLNIIGEHVFEDHAIENWNYFVGKKGLYVSTNNPNRDDFDENFLRYDIIRFEGLEYED